MSFTETKEVTYLNGHRIVVGGKTYSIERTCRMRDTSWDDGHCTWGCVCSGCGARHEYESGSSMGYCPSCGAKVVTE